MSWKFQEWVAMQRPWRQFQKLGQALLMIVCSCRCFLAVFFREKQLSVPFFTLNMSKIAGEISILEYW